MPHDSRKKSLWNLKACGKPKPEKQTLTGMNSSLENTVEEYEDAPKIVSDIRQLVSSLTGRKHGSF